MANFKQQFFLQFASLGLTELIADYRNRYEPKKGDRFNVEGITYEIGPAKITREGVEFEVSSKIPQDELPGKADMMKYFEAVRALMQRSGKLPLSIDMENIIREISEEETKERDYVKLRYCLAEYTLYNDAMVNAELKRLQEQPEAVTLPDIPGVAVEARFRPAGEGAAVGLAVGPHRRGGCGPAAAGPGRRGRPPGARP